MPNNESTIYLNAVDNVTPVFKSLASNVKSISSSISGNLTTALNPKINLGWQRQFNLGTSAAKEWGAQFSNVGLAISSVAEPATRARASFSLLGEEFARMSKDSPRLRYALYDVANSLGGIQQALLGTVKSAISTAADYETAFTGIQRTTLASKASLASLQKQFIELSNSIPVSFQDLTVIGTLGAQLGIADTDLTKFTETVAKFSATTNVSTERAAQDFGSLANLLNLTSDEYDNLASSIAYLGVKSVATETDILSVTTAISAVATSAGLSEDYVIGLSGALASLKVPSEQSRGALTRIFQEVNRAAADGGVAIDKFASVLGVTRDEATKLAQSDMETFFNKFLAGLGKMDAGTLTGTLDDLNLADIRVTNTLTRLSQNLDVVNSSLGNAALGFENGTAVNDMYAKRTEDLQAKLQVLQNVLNNIANAMGSSLIPVIKPVIDNFTAFMSVIERIASSPVGQFIMATVGSLMAFAGAAVLVAQRTALFLSGVSAMRTALNAAGLAPFIAQLKLIGPAFASGTTGALSFAGGMRAVGLSLRALATTALPILALTTVAWAIGEIFNQINKSNQAMPTYIEDVSSLTSALRSDASAIQNGATAISTFDVKVKDSSTSTNDYVMAVETATKAQVALTNETTHATDAISNQSIAYGDNAKKALASALANTTAFQNLFKANGALQATGASGEDFASAILGDPVKGGQTYVTNLMASIQSKLSSESQVTVSGLVGALKLGGALDAGALQSFADQLGISYDAALNMVKGLAELESTAKGVSASVQEAGVKSSATGAAMKALGSDAEDAATKSERFGKSFSKAFGYNDSIKSYIESINTLATGLDQNGTSFDNMTTGGLNNLSNLSAALQASANAATAMGTDAAGAISNVFAALAQQGVLTAQMLQQAVSMGGQYAVAAQATEVAQAGTYTGLTQAFNAMKSANSGAGKAADSAAKKVRTLTDYANDLANVFKRAFDIRFGASSGLDKIVKGFRSVADSIASAREEIDSLNADITSLTADKALQEYFLSVANAYGDSLSAQQIQANLVKINTDLAAKNKALAKAQDKTNKTLVGNSDAAIENRAEILGLVSDYQDYIKALAASGMGQDELRLAVQQAQADFMAQATQLGYNSTELGTYATAFNDVTTAINNVPRDITVEANVDPAIQAMNELRARADAAAAPRTIQIGAAVDYQAMAKFARGAAIVAEINRLNGLSASYPGMVARGEIDQATVDDWENQIAIMLRIYAQRLNSGDFSSGGYTGAGGKYDVAGIVHRGEYVVPKEQVNQQTGLPYYMQQPRSFAQGGFVSGQSSSVMMVELSPYDRNLLAQAGNIQLRLDGKVIAQNTNNNNLVSAQRGSN